MIKEKEVNGDNFTNYRKTIREEFNDSSAVRKTKFTQGLYWTDFDKDLADQFLREEVWLFGIKIRDAIKIIDHCSSLPNKNKVGF